MAGDEIDDGDEIRERVGMIRGLQSSGRVGDRKAREHKCPTCRGYVVSGFDAGTLGEYVSCDPGHLDAEDQRAYQLAGRRLYLLRTSGGRLELDYADEYMKPGTATRPVLGEHWCPNRKRN